MRDDQKDKTQLIAELQAKRQRIDELEKSESIRKQTQNALEQKMREMEIFVNNIPHMAWLKDSDSNFLLANQKFGNVVGMDPEYLRSHTCAVCFGEEAAEKFKADDREVIKGKKQITLEETIVDKDGNRICLETTKSPIFNNTGDVVGTVGIAVDVTMRKQAEEALSQYRERLEKMVEERTSELQQEITERKLASKALRESEEKYRTLVEYSSDLIFLIDNKGIVISVNQAAAGAMGKEPQEIQGKKVSELFPKEIADGYKRNLKKVFKTGAGETYESTMLAGEQTIWISTSLNPVTDNAGKIVAVLGVSRNISDSKQAEAALHESEERFRVLFDSGTDMAFVSEVKRSGLPGKIIEINNNTINKLGYSRNELLQMSPLDIASPQKKGDYISLAKMFVIKNRIIFETVFVTKSGIEIPVEISAEIIKLEGKQVLISVARDITERKQAEEALRESEERYRTLVEDSPIAIMVHSEGKIDYTNPAAMKLIGATSEQELLGKSVMDFVHPEYHNIVGKRVKDIYEKKREASPIEEKFVRLDGKIIDVEVNGKIINFRGKPASQVIISDITERKQVKRALLESESKYRSLIEYSNDAIYLLYDRKFEIINNKFERMFGYTLEEVNKPEFDFINLVAPKSRSLIEDRIKRAARGEKLSHNYEFTALTENGKELEVEASVNYISYRDGIATQGIIRDITERKRAEEALQESEGRFKAIFETAQDSIFIKDRELRYVQVNPAMERLFELPAAKLIGRTDEDLFGEEAGAHVKDVDSHVLNGEVVEEEHSKPIKGIQVTFHVIKVPMRDRAGQIIGLCGIARDITEHKQAEEALKESEEHFRTLIENASDVISILDEKGNVIYESPSHKRVLGYNTGYLIGKNVFEFVHPDDRERISLQFAGLLQKPGEIEKVYFRFLHQDGSWRHIEGAGRNLLKSPSIKGIVVNYWDATDSVHAEEEKAKLEKQLRRSQKMETIGTLAGGIAHDFNNILTPIMGYTDMAITSLAPTDPLVDDLKHVLKGANRAKELVEQILLFSRQIEQERKPLKLNLIVKEAVQLLRPSIPTSIEIRQRIDASCEKVLADPAQMHQVIVNLCTNSFQAMEEKGGVLTIELKQVEVDAVTAKSHPNLEQKEYVRLTVSDTGGGMDGATVDRIFDPFFTTKTVDKGTGLGLSVVYGIVRSHKGEILVCSEQGKGSTFHVYLPMSEGEGERDKKEAQLIQGGEESILVVDDEKIVSDVVKKMLERYGYQVDVYNSSIEALKAFRQHPDNYDLVISDLTMPTLTGLDLAKQLHKTRSGIPIILMTGYGESVSGDIIKHYGIEDVIGKPIEMRKLAAAVRMAVDK